MSLFTKTYDLSLCRNYVGHWGMKHAVRELIQNALDSDSPFVLVCSTGPATRVKTPHEILGEWFEEHRFNMHLKCRGPFREILERAKAWR